MPKAITQQEFISKCINRFGNKFDYSKVKYESSKSKILIKCGIHGWFEQGAWKHLNNKIGCLKCVAINVGNIKRKTQDDFICDAIKIHGNLYDYSEVKYISSFKKIKIICKRHGKYTQIPANHIMGNGCPKCRNLLTQDEFIKKCKEIHGNYYDYSIVKYQHNQKKIKIICPIHGEFEQKAKLHKDGKGCPTCNLSKGELKVQRYLELNDIKFIRQKQFDDCVNEKTGYKLKYDFYLPDKNILIEYNGKQHYEMYKNWTNETQERFENRQFKDAIKNEYAINNDMKLIKIKYTNFKKVEEILNRELK